MTVEQALLSGASFLIIMFLGIISFFLRRILHTQDSHSLKLAHLDKCLDDYKLTVEKTFVSHDTYTKFTEKLREDVKEIFNAITKIKESIARLEARRRGK